MATNYTITVVDESGGGTPPTAANISKPTKSQPPMTTQTSAKKTSAFSGAVGSAAIMGIARGVGKSYASLHFNEKNNNIAGNRFQFALRSAGAVFAAVKFGPIGIAAGAASFGMSIARYNSEVRVKDREASFQRDKLNVTDSSGTRYSGGRGFGSGN